MTRAPLEHLIRAATDIADDTAITRAAAAHGLVRREVILERIGAMPIDDATRELVLSRIAVDLAQS